MEMIEWEKTSHATVPLKEDFVTQATAIKN
jgi:hypothetical protein